MQAATRVTTLDVATRASAAAILPVPGPFLLWRAPFRDALREHHGRQHNSALSKAANTLIKRVDQKDFDKLKAEIGEEAAIRYERSLDAGQRVRAGKGRPLDPVSNIADGLLFEVYAVGHLAGEAAKAVGHAAERAAHWIETEAQHVIGHDKPLETPPPSSQGPQLKGK
jgi:hypothetical protein